MMTKQTIKNILREGTEKNSLGVVVTRPNQELIVLRGISGSGKSTKAKSMVGNGVIHSTDDVIEAGGDYNEFFAKMIASGDFSDLSRAHSTNKKNAIRSIESGVSPVIIDNTNIKQNEPKEIVVAALKLGLADNNIKFVDIGAAGLVAEELAKRNSHGVPLEKIEQMIASHTGQGPMTLKSVLDAKDMYKPSKIAMVVLDNASVDKLIKAVRHFAPADWKTFAHHMTINFGKGLTGEVKDDLGKKVSLKAVAVGKSDMAMAVRVEGYHSDNEIPHITVAVNVAAGGKPANSNKITDWKDLPSYINLNGVVTEENLG